MFSLLSQFGSFFLARMERKRGFVRVSFSWTWKFALSEDGSHRPKAAISGTFLYQEHTARTSRPKIQNLQTTCIDQNSNLQKICRPQFAKHWYRLKIDARRLCQSLVIWWKTGPRQGMLFLRAVFLRAKSSVWLACSVGNFGGLGKCSKGRRKIGTTKHMWAFARVLMSEMTHGSSCMDATGNF